MMQPLFATSNFINTRVLFLHVHSPLHLHFTAVASSTAHIKQNEHGPTMPFIFIFEMKVATFLASSGRRKTLTFLYAASCNTRGI